MLLPSTTNYRFYTSASTLGCTIYERNIVSACNYRGNKSGQNMSLTRLLHVGKVWVPTKEGE